VRQQPASPGTVWLGDSGIEPPDEHIGTAVGRQTFKTRAEARIKISTWIADFYNTSRRHTANDGLAPITFEPHMAETRRTSTPQLRAEVA
jgi:hypothetical protein